MIDFYRCLHHDQKSLLHNYDHLLSRDKPQMIGIKQDAWVFLQEMRHAHSKLLRTWIWSGTSWCKDELSWLPCIPIFLYRNSPDPLQGKKTFHPPREVSRFFIWRKCNQVGIICLIFPSRISSPHRPLVGFLVLYLCSFLNQWHPWSLKCCK